MGFGSSGHRPKSEDGLAVPLRYTSAMKRQYIQPEDSPSDSRSIAVREVPIELCQFIKFAGLSESGGEAKQLIAEGKVLLNGSVETQKRKKLAVNDRVEVNGQTIVVKLA